MRHSEANSDADFRTYCPTHGCPDCPTFQTANPIADSAAITPAFTSADSKTNSRTNASADDEAYPRVLHQRGQGR